MANLPSNLDPLAKAFLKKGGGSEPPMVVRDQHADPDKQAAAYERELMAEAVDLGDVLISYVAAHPKLSFGQRAFGVVLGLMNLRRDYPAGVEKFDAITSLAGDDTKVDNRGEKAGPVLPDPPALKESEQLEAAKFTEAFLRYVTGKVQGGGMTNQQGAYGLGRLFHALRLGFPVEAGRVRGFDVYAQQAGEYFAKG